MDGFFCNYEKENLKKPYCEEDCILEFVEKIREHYINFRTKLNDNEKLINKLKKANNDLEKTVVRLNNELNANAKRRKVNSLNESDLDDFNLFNCGAVLAEKSTDDLNIALNTENQFENTFLSPQKLSNQKNVPTNPSNVAVPIRSSPKTEAFFVKRKPICMKKLHNNEKKNAWQSKNDSRNANETDPSDSVEDKFQDSKKKEAKSKKLSKLSLKASTNKLKQSRLDYNILKNDSSEASFDETFCDEIIDASPRNHSSSVRQLRIRKNSSTEKTSDMDDFFQFSKKSTGGSVHNNIKQEQMTQQEDNVTTTSNQVKTDNFDSSSLIILPTQTEEIISISDNSESINIESDYLLHDMMNDKFDDLNYMRQIEIDRIREIQNRHKITEESKSANIEKSTLKSSTKLKTASVKVERPESEIQIDCKECLSYFKYLRKAMGDKLTDEEINRRLRSCTKHNKPTDINLTPEGFWDPFIRSLPADDPRNETLIDTRFRDKKNMKM